MSNKCMWWRLSWTSAHIRFIYLISINNISHFTRQWQNLFTADMTLIQVCFAWDRALVRGHLFMNPIQQISYIGVNTKVTFGSTSVAPACSSFDVPLASIFAHQRTPTITLTSVYATLIITGAQHGVVNPAGIAFEAAIFRDQRYFSLHKFTSWGPSGRQTSPTLKW